MLKLTRGGIFMDAKTRGKGDWKDREREDRAGVRDEGRGESATGGKGKRRR